MSRVLTGFLCFLVIFNFFFEFAVVDGNSMFPSILDHQLVLVRKYIDFFDGEIVEAVDNEGVIVFKRVKWYKQGKVFLEGDNSIVSLDSRTLGPVYDFQVKGVVCGTF